jgi:7-carboxy-7-deazaguanine synthase
MSREEILSKVAQFATPLVELTGGEPLIQQGSRPLLHELCESGKTVLLETNGERSIARIDERVHRIMDIKTPSSAVSHKNRWQNIALLTKRDEIKFVLLDRADYEWTRDVILRESLWERVAEVLLSPVHEKLEPRQLVSWVLADGLNVRVQLQLHKYIWNPDTKNV